MEILLYEADYIKFQMVKGKGGPCACYKYGNSRYGSTRS